MKTKFNLVQDWCFFFFFFFFFVVVVDDVMYLFLLCELDARDILVVEINTASLLDRSRNRSGRQILYMKMMTRKSEIILKSFDHSRECWKVKRKNQVE